VARSEIGGAPGRRILMAGCALLLCATLGIGFLRHYTPRADVMATAEPPREDILKVRTRRSHAQTPVSYRCACRP
jgi:hypothetical protein